MIPVAACWTPETPLAYLQEQNVGANGEMKVLILASHNPTSTTIKYPRIYASPSPHGLLAVWPVPHSIPGHLALAFKSNAGLPAVRFRLSNAEPEPVTEAKDDELGPIMPIFCLKDDAGFSC